MWTNEIDARVDDILSGRVEGIPWAQVKEEAARVAARHPGSLDASGHNGPPQSAGSDHRQQQIRG